MASIWKDEKVKWVLVFHLKVINYFKYLKEQIGIFLNMRLLLGKMGCTCSLPSPGTLLRLGKKLGEKELHCSISSSSV